MSQSVAKVWAEDLARVDIADAVDAVTMHYRESSDWLMPAHVIRNSRRVREARERAARRQVAIEPTRVTFPGREWWDAEVAKAIASNERPKP